MHQRRARYDALYNYHYLTPLLHYCCHNSPNSVVTVAMYSINMTVFRLMVNFSAAAHLYRVVVFFVVLFTVLGNRPDHNAAAVRTAQSAVYAGRNKSSIGLEG